MGAAKYVRVRCWKVTILVGTAGWTIPRQASEDFPSAGSALERYAAKLPVVEINSSFHRPHRISTWERWRDSVPGDFRFSVKIPKTITHSRKLTDCDRELDEFLPQVEALGAKLAVLLVQLPPKLPFDRAVARPFFSGLRDRTRADIACEPRHGSWFTDEASKLLEQLDVARVAADPPICKTAAIPGDWGRLSYWRLHGSPVVYRSSYLDRIDHYARQLHDQAIKHRTVWCIFDNTASSAGASDALALLLHGTDPGISTSSGRLIAKPAQ